MRLKTRLMGRLALAAFTVLGLAGCPKVDKPPAGGGQQKAHDHEHEAPHGGLLAEWGDHEYHAEFTVDPAKKEATVYILDGNARKAPKGVKGEDIKNVRVIVKKPMEATIELKHDPAKSGEGGIAFVGTHDKLDAKGNYQGEITGEMNGKPYQGDFPEVHDR
jgi:hypothetical protein